jgi:hypothetical protein
MLRKASYDHRMITEGWVSIDRADEAILEGVYKKNIREGVERLMLAVLESAVEDFQKYVLARHPSTKKLFQEAEEWFLEDDIGAALFSFASICETLQIHPEYIRKRLLVWKEAKTKVPSVEVHHQPRTKSRSSRTRSAAVRLSKTA